MKHIARIVLFTIVLIAVPVITLFPRGGFFTVLDGDLLSSLEEYTHDNFPLRGTLSRIGTELLMTGGMREINGVFVGSDTMVKNIPAPDSDTLEKNLEALSKFAEYARSYGKQIYFTLIPTAAAISKDAIPLFAEVFDERLLIEEVYGRLAGKLMTIDSYLPLYMNNEQYLFYRTEDNLTAYGGFHVYTALIKRMLAISEPTYHSYEVSYGAKDYYGGLYTGTLFNDIRPDTLILYKYSHEVREYIITHRDYSGVRTYHTLYPAHMSDMGRDMDVYFGGLSAITDITTSQSDTRSLSLLLFGDKTALSYLPMLVNHYSRVTFIDVSRDDTVLDNFDIEEYDQILLAYSIETYASKKAVLTRLGMFMEK